MKVKICGVCRPDDAAAAVAANADFLGVILTPGWRRTQDEPSAAAIFASAGDLQRVGVFVDPPIEQVTRLARALALDVIQLHGQEDVRTIERIRESTSSLIWKTILPSFSTDLSDAIEMYGDAADGLLLDAAGVIGIGGGHRFDWELAASARQTIPARLTLITAGGLTPDNVAQAIARMSPDIVDVSSGVENDPGEKSATKIAAFVRNAKE